MKDIIIAILCSSAVSSFVQFIVQRWDTRNSILKLIKELSDGFEEYKAEIARLNILRFNDDLHNKEYHSEEHFKQIIRNIDTYNLYCEKHKEFSNGLTVMASEYIRNEYKRRYLEGNVND